MIAMVRDMFQHQAYADAALLTAIKAHPAAAEDQELRAAMHHVLLAHRFWIHLAQALPYAVEDEAQPPHTLDELIATFKATQDLETPWLASLSDADLSRTLESPFFPGRQVPLSEALVQVCLHSHGHRAQCSAKLRQLGGSPPVLDYISWSDKRRAPAWD